MRGLLPLTTIGRFDKGPFGDSEFYVLEPYGEPLPF